MWSAGPTRTGALAHSIDGTPFRELVPLAARVPSMIRSHIPPTHALSQNTPISRGVAPVSRETAEPQWTVRTVAGASFVWVR